MNANWILSVGAKNPMTWRRKVVLLVHNRNGCRSTSARRAKSVYNKIISEVKGLNIDKYS